MRTTVTSSVSKVPTAGQHGYIDVGGHFRGARTDDELAQAILHRENDAVFVYFGTSWCRTCKALLPKFIDMSYQFKNLDYVVASVDTMAEAVKVWP